MLSILLPQNAYFTYISHFSYPYNMAENLHTMVLRGYWKLGNKQQIYKAMNNRINKQNEKKNL